MTYSALPGVLNEIAQVAGIDAAWEIARAQGGITVYIPYSATEDHWLTELVGLDNASKICEHFRVGNTGMRILIPMARYHQAKDRLVKALEAGMSAPEAASTAGVHERTAYRARRKLGLKNDQGSLF
ncbi:helix-turn-helix domain-containing protein [Ochrobactrum sp. MR28]|nr:helix-turn-helix domain-containing protein [Ochrobactrum sp. MR28]MBX8814765.1 helix-turn-helix domain-containing protein [Ochrobactrum sp. MR31]